LLVGRSRIECKGAAERIVESMAEDDSKRFEERLKKLVKQKPAEKPE
jgi:hypothetical protein